MRWRKLLTVLKGVMPIASSRPSRRAGFPVSGAGRVGGAEKSGPTAPETDRFASFSRERVSGGGYSPPVSTMNPIVTVFVIWFFDRWLATRRKTLYRWLHSGYTDPKKKKPAIF